jgi:TonB family protein
MHDRVTNRFLQKSFLVALILHALFLLSFITIITIPPIEQEKVPDLQTVPSYLFTGSIQPTAAVEPAKSSPAVIMPQDKQESAAEVKQQPQNVQHTPNPIYTQPKLKKMSVQKLWGRQESIMDRSRQILRQNQITRAMKRSKDPEPVLLVGDSNTDASPLVNLMARALSANFRYPEIEGNFGIHGKVLVQLTFHPEGYFSDPEILQSSNNDNFDAAALYAINKAPPVVGAKRFLSAPKTYVVGFIFD